MIAFLKAFERPEKSVNLGEFLIFRKISGFVAGLSIGSKCWDRTELKFFVNYLITLGNKSF